MRASKPFAVAILLVGMIGCDASERPSSRDRGHARASKQELFGDPGLVPTREGERTRRELALASEVERLLAARGIEAAVAVALPSERSRDSASVAVVARVPPSPALQPGRADEALHDQIAALTHATIPGLEPARVHVWMQPSPASTTADQPEPSSRALTGLAIASALGLGLALGITGERVLARRRA